MGSQPLGFQKDLVTFLVGKPIDLVLDARAIARPNTFYLPREHGAATEATANDVVCAGVGVGNPASHLCRMLLHTTHKTKDRLRHPGAPGHAVTRLLDTLTKVDGATIQTRWCSRLEPTLRQFELFQPSRKAHRRRVPCPAGRIVCQSDMDLSIQKRPSGQHDCFGAEFDAGLRHRANHPVTMHHQVVNRLLKQEEIVLILQAVANRCFVQQTVCLGPGRTHGWTLTRI